MTAKQTCHSPYRVVIVGAGVAGLETALALQRLAGSRVEVSLLAPDHEFVYRPMSVREPFGGSVAKRYPIDRVARDAGVKRYADSFKWIDRNSQVIHTTDHLELEYDAAVLAVGARRVPVLRHATTLDDHRLDEQLHGLIQDIEQGYVHSLAFVVPSTRCWPLPAYELALMTAARAYAMNVELKITFVTTEPWPLAMFGQAVSDRLRQMLGECGITVIHAPDCQGREPGLLCLPRTGEVVKADHIVALPELYGPGLAGVPTSAHNGFLSVDPYSRVAGVEHLYAAGDATDFPVKFGGIAALQADAAAASIAAEAGAQIEPKPMLPLIRGILLGGREPLHIEAQISGSSATYSEANRKPFSEMPPKIHARYLEPYLESLDRQAASTDSSLDLSA